MNPCPRVGVDTQWRCNWTCSHCFYRRNPKLHTDGEVPTDQIKDKVRKGKQGGCDHVVFVGHGEPTLDKRLPALLDFCHGEGMATSIITNGATNLGRIASMFGQGLDHLHISSHGIGSTLTKITGCKDAFEKQTKLKDFLAEAGYPFRTNAAIQQANYEELPLLARHEIAKGVHHFVLLGFLPHYEWSQHVDEVAVHPATLRPYIEEAADILIEAGTLFTIRYHPMCHLRPDLWKYVVNARYVFFDPWEWNYELQVRDLKALWEAAVRCGKSVEVAGKPCSECKLYRHCGGWNRVYAAAFGGAGLSAIQDIPEEYASVINLNGGLHDLNPANHERGTIQ